MQYKVFDKKHEKGIFEFSFVGLALISIILGIFMIIINHIYVYITFGAFLAFIIVCDSVCWIININTYPKSFIHKDSELIVYDGRKREIARFDLNQCVIRRQIYVFVPRKKLSRYQIATPQECLIISNNAEEIDKLLKIKEIEYANHRINSNILIVQNPESIIYIESIMQKESVTPYKKFEEKIDHNDVLKRGIAPFVMSIILDVAFLIPSICVSVYFLIGVAGSLVFTVDAINYMIECCYKEIEYFEYNNERINVYNKNNVLLKSFDIRGCKTKQSLVSIPDGMDSFHKVCLILYKDLELQYKDTEFQKAKFLKNNKKVEYIDYLLDPNVFIVQNPESIAFIESIMQGQQPQEENTTA